jgi:uncharacterized protein YodC (DUF2158 family)
MSDLKTDLKAGDVVRLRSGGPRMTVSSVNEPLHFVDCVWFLSASGGLQTGHFAPEAVAIVEDAVAIVEDAVVIVPDVKAE